MFAPLTIKGREHLKASPHGEWKNGSLTVTNEEDASDVMDYAINLPVYAYE